MANVPTYYSNPWADFDPSQWSNPYSSYQSSALPMPSYVGVPYNSMGQPIQPTPGMTVNQTPSQPTPAPTGASNTQQQWAYNNAMLNAMGQNAGQGQPSPNIVNLRQMNNQMYGMQQPWGGPVLQSSGPNAAQPAAGAAAPAVSANAAGLTPQQYMAMRANPGYVTTPGATVPQASSAWQPSNSGVLQQFLANWKPASSGPGSGFQQGFSTALKGMGY